VTDAALTVVAAEETRRRLTARQAAVVEQLIDAAAQEARRHGYGGLSVRGVARRAGVAPATAYTYFASKDHLLAEVLWRRLQALPLESEDGAGVADRLNAVMGAMGLFMADDPKLAAACTTALLGSGPEVRDLRVRFGTAVHDRLAAALGDHTDGAVLRSLELAYSGAMLWAGLGHIAYEDVPRALADAARLILDGSP
jgi:AcrR family transcriptional regulator